MIDEVYGLQRYKEGWGGEWKEKLDIRECIQDQGFEKVREHAETRRGKYD